MLEQQENRLDEWLMEIMIQNNTPECHLTIQEILDDLPKEMRNDDNWTLHICRLCYSQYNIPSSFIILVQLCN